jgi:hypothetical protein
MIEDESNQGRPLNKAQWLAFKEATTLVSHDIERYRFEWDEQDERHEGNRSEPGGDDNDGADHQVETVVQDDIHTESTGRD